MVRQRFVSIIMVIVEENAVVMKSEEKIRCGKVKESCEEDGKKGNG